MFLLEKLILTPNPHSHFRTSNTPNSPEVTPFSKNRDIRSFFRRPPRIPWNVRILCKTRPRSHKWLSDLGLLYTTPVCFLTRVPLPPAQNYVYASLCCQVHGSGRINPSGQPTRTFKGLEKKMPFRSDSSSAPIIQK